MSEIRVDTISEKTSANGVAIDGLTIKDGGISATTGAIVFNEASADLDFRVESDGNTHMLFVDGGNNRVGIATTPDLGVGLHIRTADSGASVDTNADELVVEGSGSSGISILSGTGNEGAIKWGDSGDNNIAYISYDHAGNDMYIGVNAATRMKIDDTGAVTMQHQPAFLVTPASDQTSLANNDTIVFGTEIFDQNADFASNTFTAPVTGRYLLSFALRLELIQENTTYALFSLVTSNRSYQNIFDSSTSDSTIDFRSFTMSVLADMDANDTVTVVFGEAGGSTGQTRVSEAESFFSGVLVC